MWFCFRPLSSLKLFSRAKGQKNSAGGKNWIKSPEEWSSDLEENNNYFIKHPRHVRRMVNTYIIIIRFNLNYIFKRSYIAVYRRISGGCAWWKLNSGKYSVTCSCMKAPHPLLGNRISDNSINCNWREWKILYDNHMIVTK